MARIEGKSGLRKMYDVCIETPEIEREIGREPHLHHNEAEVLPANLELVANPWFKFPCPLGPGSWISRVFRLALTSG